MFLQSHVICWNYLFIFYLMTFQFRRQVDLFQCQVKYRSTHLQWLFIQNRKIMQLKSWSCHYRGSAVWTIPFSKSSSVRLICEREEKNCRINLHTTKLIEQNDKLSKNESVSVTDLVIKRVTWQTSNRHKFGVGVDQELDSIQILKRKRSHHKPTGLFT